MLRDLDVPAADLPIVIVPAGRYCAIQRPRAAGRAGPVRSRRRLPVRRVRPADSGRGPGGLAAAVYGASEGMTTTLAEESALGGQAGTSSRIENYLGFPAGLSGEELAARAVLQAQKFGVQIRLAARAVSWRRTTACTRSASRTATPCRPSRSSSPPAPGTTGCRWTGSPSSRGWASITRPPRWRPRRARRAGRGRRWRQLAGQAALFLARTCAAVHIIIRGETLAAPMSHYLTERIERDPHIIVSTQTRVTGLTGRAGWKGCSLPSAAVRRNRNWPSGAVRLHRREARNGVARRSARPRRARFSAYRHGHPSFPGSSTVVAGVAALPRNQQAGDLLRRRCPQ